MTTTTRELVAANDALREEFENALIVDAAFHANGFHLTVIPRDIKEDSQTGIGATVEDALAALRAKLTAAESERDGYKARCERLEKALRDIVKHWRYVGGALSEHSPIVKIAEAALATREDA
jgi:hypothetical protein